MAINATKLKLKSLPSALTWLVCVSLIIAVTSRELVHGQETRSSGDDKRTAQVQEIIEGPQWQAMLQRFEKWLSIQQIYSPEEVVAIKNDFNTRILQMQPKEVKQFLEDMNARLDVLMSEPAEEARQWVNQFMSVTRNPQERLAEKRPDVMRMSAAEIRNELQQFQQQQATRQQAQAAFNRTRELQVQSARELQSSRQQAWEQLSTERSRAAVNAQPRSPYAPLPQDLPNYTNFRYAVPAPLSPAYTVGPWGAPVRWNPLRDEPWWWW